MIRSLHRERRLSPCGPGAGVHCRRRRRWRRSKGKRGERLSRATCIVLAGCGPAGTGMEETYQLTSALKHLPWGKQVALVTDARFSGVSTGACIGHVGPEALAGGPIGKVLDDDWIEIDIDLRRAEGRVDLVGPWRRAA